MRIAATALMVLLLLSPTVSAAGEPNVWYPNFDGTASRTPGASGLMVIARNGIEWWAAETTSVPFSFGSNSWDVSLRLSSKPLAQFRVAIGYDSGSGLIETGATYFAHADTNVGSGHCKPIAGSTDYLCTGTISMTQEFVIPAGSRLAFRIDNTQDGKDKGAKDVNLRTGHIDTWLGAPAGFPSYPTPELATLALVGLGLVGVAAVAIRRRG